MLSLQHMMDTWNRNNNDTIILCHVKKFHQWWTNLWWISPNKEYNWSILIHKTSDADIQRLYCMHNQSVTKSPSTDQPLSRCSLDIQVRLLDPVILAGPVNIQHVTKVTISVWQCDCFIFCNTIYWVTTVHIQAGNGKLIRKQNAAFHDRVMHVERLFCAQ